jgi:hypothetical protein
MSQVHRYLFWLAMGLMTSLLACAAFAILVDPYFIFGTPVLSGFNARHPDADNQMIAAHSHLASRMRPRTLLLGNSRVQVGFDPASRVWPKAMTPVFNGGMGGEGLDSTPRIIEAALAGGRLQNMLIGVEFLDTMSPIEHREIIPPVRIPVPFLARTSALAADWFNATLTIGALQDSVETVLRQWSPSDNIMHPDGSYELGEYVEYVRQRGGAALFNRQLDEYQVRFATYIAPDFRNPEKSTTLRSLVELLDAARAAECSVSIFVYPYHASVLDLIRSMGLWLSFEQFKRVLVQVVWTRNPGTRIIDFSGYNAFTTEAPPPNMPGQEMRWYWEPGHFRTSLGDQMIDRLYGKGSGFGRELRPDNVEAVLAAIRQESDERRAEHLGQQRSAMATMSSFR